MNYEAVLFDLDGTLIYFDPQLFIKTYLGAAAQFFIDLIPDPESFYKEIISSTDVMENGDNESTTTLEDFLIDFCPKFDVDCENIVDKFHSFYQDGYDVIKPLISQIEGSKNLLSDLKKQYPELKIILATNPVFPFVAVQKRMLWGDISENFFNLITHAENSYYCKNNKHYWLNIAKDMGINPENSIMIGNDGFRDLSAKECGYETFLLETAAENEDLITKETEPDYRGSIKDLYNLLIDS